MPLMKRGSYLPNNPMYRPNNVRPNPDHWMVKHMEALIDFGVGRKASVSDRPRFANLARGYRVDNDNVGTSQIRPHAFHKDGSGSSRLSLQEGRFGWGMYNYSLDTDTNSNAAFIRPAGTGGNRGSWDNNQKFYVYVCCFISMDLPPSGTSDDQCSIMELGGGSRGISIDHGATNMRCALRNDSDHSVNLFPTPDRTKREPIRIVYRFEGSGVNTLDGWGAHGDTFGHGQATGTGSSITTHSNNMGIMGLNNQTFTTNDGNFTGYMYNIAINFGLSPESLAQPWKMTEDHAEEYLLDPWCWCRPKRKLFYTTGSPPPEESTTTPVLAPMELQGFGADEMFGF